VPRRNRPKHKRQSDRKAQHFRGKKRPRSYHHGQNRDREFLLAVEKTGLA
jgi:hypothetical protein